MPDDIHFKSLEKRIVHMANVKASVGELEILSTAGHLQQTIVIVDKDFQKISVYSISVAASRIQQASSGIKVKAHQILPLPQKSPIVLSRTSRCQQAELITSSPVKRRLQAQKSRARPGQAKQHPSKRARNGPQKKNDVDQEESWYCQICGENVQEAMTQCISCLHWVHNKCADESHILRYVCDLRK